jgi:apolipoprotein N-acyltransferase
MMLGGLNLFYYLHSVLGAPIMVWVAAYASVAVAFAAGVLLFRALLFRGAVWSALVALPAVWVTLEYARNFATPHGTGGSIAYTQLRFLPFLQLASVTGPWGMSFVLLLLAPAVAIGIYLWPKQRQRAVRVIGATVGLIVLILIFGAVRLAQPTGETVQMGLIASDEKPYSSIVDEGKPAEQLFQIYAAQAEMLAEQGAKAIVLPEMLAVVLETRRQQADTIFQSLADRTGATIIVGTIHVVVPLTYNEARVYAPHVVMASYRKHHLLPPFESRTTPGTTMTVLPRGDETWGVAICKDMDFTRLLRRYGEAGVGVMLVPAWDFRVDRSWHGHIAVMRGVEDGFSMVRSAKGGYLTVSDSRGRIIAESRSDAAPFSTLMANVPVEHHPTIYLRLGDWFPWAAMALLVWVLLRLGWRRNAH